MVSNERAFNTSLKLKKEGITYCMLLYIAMLLYVGDTTSSYRINTPIKMKQHLKAKKTCRVFKRLSSIIYNLLASLP